MPIPAVIHIVGEDAFIAELEELPNPTHSYVIMRNMRKKDGKPLPYLTDGASASLYAWSRITFIEILGEIAETSQSSKATPQGTTVLGFFRDDDR